jgi:hypothetical protein
MVEKETLVMLALRDDVALLAADVIVPVVDTPEEAKEPESVSVIVLPGICAVIGKSTPSDDTKVTAIETTPDEEVTIPVTSLDNEATTLVIWLPIPLLPLSPAESIVEEKVSSLDDEVVAIAFGSPPAVVMDVIVPGFAAVATIVIGSGT